MRFPVNILSFSGAPRIIGLLAAGVASTLVLFGCSAVKLAYNQMPDLGYFYLDNYLDFNSAQSTQVKDELVKLQAWHRQNQLPAYVDSLQKWKTEVTADISPARACTIYSDVRRKVLTITDHAEPAIASLAGTLDQDQLAYMQKRFDKSNAEFRNDYIEAAPKASRKKRVNQAVERAEKLYGQLEDRQLALVTQSVDQSRFDPRVVYAERVRRQRDLLQSLQNVVAAKSTSAQSLDKTRAMVKAVVERTVTSPDAAFRDYSEKFTQEGCRSFADLHNATTAEQRTHAVKTLAKYEEDFRTLMARN
ncbi:MAG: DUF6279 family lipoprotein [Pseudomonadota bacterium]